MVQRVKSVFPVERNATAKHHKSRHLQVCCSEFNSEFLPGKALYVELAALVLVCDPEEDSAVQSVVRRLILLQQSVVCRKTGGLCCGGRHFLLRKVAFHNTCLSVTFLTAAAYRLVAMLIRAPHNF